MDRKYNVRLDLQFRCNNSVMEFDEFDKNTSDFFIRVTKGNKLIDISKAIVTLVAIKPDNSVDAQFVEIRDNNVYCDLKPSMKDITGKYEAIASITVNGETVNTDVISYEVTGNKFLRQLNNEVVAEERFTILTDMINRLFTIELQENSRIDAETNRVEAEKQREIVKEKLISDMKKLVVDTNKKIDDYKLEKDTAINLDLQQYKTDTTQDIDNYKNLKDAEIDEQMNRLDANEDIRINQEKARIKSEDARVVSEKNRVEEFEVIKEDYNTYKNVMISESNVAALQKNINDNSTQIKEKANEIDLDVERKRIDSFTSLQEGSTTGDAELMDIRIGADSNEYVTAGQAVREQIKPYVKYVGVNSENLFDYINATDGYYNSLDGTLNTTSGYKTTGLIPYKVGDVIRKSKDVSWFVQWIGFFDINGNILISDIGIDDYVDRSNSSYDEFCLSEKPQNGSLDNLAYITIAVSNFGETNDFANYMIVKNIDYPSNYVPYGFNYSNNFTNKILEEIEKNVVTPPIQIPSILDNKTLLFSGDSIMQALIENGDGTYGESYGWAELLKESNPLAIVKNYGQGGTTIAKRSDRTDSILERIDKMHTENPNADYIIFEGGVNDCYSNVPLGEITSDYNSLFDESTFCGALESLLKQAIVKWKGKKICYIVTFKVPTADYANFSEYMKKAKEICEKWSIPYIDLYTQSGMEYHIKEIATAYSYGGGGLHPNIEGYKLTIPKIAEFIKSL